MRILFYVSLFVFLQSCAKQESSLSNLVRTRHIEENIIKMKNPEYLWLINGEILPIESLKNEIYQKIILEKGVRKIDLPFIDNTNRENYLLSDGKLVTRFKDYQPILFNSVFDFKKSKEINTLNTFSILDGLNPLGVHFPEHTNKLGHELCEKLNIQFELSTKILKEIDEKMNLLDADSLYKFRHKYFINIISIVGGVFISESQKKGINSTWKMEKASLTFSPLLIVNNQRLDFWMYLYEDMFENFHEKPLEECYLTMIGIYETSIK